MAKTAKLKKKSTSIHSRAARRATSPSLNLDKTLKELRAASPTKPHPSTAFSGDGIRKRKKALTRAQKLQQRKRIERGEIVNGRTEVKLTKSLGRLKSVKERSKDWEVVNGEKRKKKKSGEEGEEDDDDVWVDEVVVMKPLAVTEQAEMERPREVELKADAAGTSVTEESVAPSKPVVDEMIDDIL